MLIPDYLPLDSKRSYAARLREYYLNEIDAWYAGKKATPGMPANGRNYAHNLQSEVTRYDKLLAELAKEIAALEN